MDTLQNLTYVCNYNEGAHILTHRVQNCVTCSYLIKIVLTWLLFYSHINGNNRSLLLHAEVQRFLLLVVLVQLLALPALQTSETEKEIESKPYIVISLGYCIRIELPILKLLQQNCQGGLLLLHTHCVAHSDIYVVHIIDCNWQCTWHHQNLSLVCWYVSAILLRSIW